MLLQALPYIERFRGTVAVVKFGGNAMTSPDLFHDFAQDVVLLHRVGLKPVVVHGGGPQIGEWLRRLGKETSFVDGRRVTDAETLEVAQMVLMGKVNSDIVTALNAHGPVALGLAGTDAQMLEAKAHDPELGYVGTVTKVNPRAHQPHPGHGPDPRDRHHRCRCQRSDLQHQRGRRRHRSGRGVGGREAHLPHGRARPVGRRRTIPTA